MIKENDNNYNTVSKNEKRFMHCSKDSNKDMSEIWGVDLAKLADKVLDFVGEHQKDGEYTFKLEKEYDNKEDKLNSLSFTISRKENK